MENYKKQLKYKKKLLLAGDKLTEKYKKYYKKISKDDLEALNYYKGFGYEFLNKIINNKKLDESYTLDYIPEIKDGREVVVKGLHDYIKSDLIKTLSYIPIIDNIFTKMPATDRVITVFRGIKEDKKNKFISKYKVGDKIKFNSYTSTSMSPEVSARFTQGMKTSCCFMVITIPKNVKMIYIPWIPYKKSSSISLKNSSFGADEFELLLPRGSEFVVKNIESIKTTDIVLQEYKKYKELLKNISSKNNILVYHLHYIGNNPDPIYISADQLLSTVKKICIENINLKNKFSV